MRVGSDPADRLRNRHPRRTGPTDNRISRTRKIRTPGGRTRIARSTCVTSGENRERSLHVIFTASEPA